jgi:RNA polymerase sigma-70 factor, ECF subfamily
MEFRRGVVRNYQPNLERNLYSFRCITYWLTRSVVNTSSSSNVYDVVGILHAWPGQKIELTCWRRAWNVGLRGSESTPEVPEDTRLVSDARNGDREAFGRLYDRYARMVHGVLLAKVPAGAVDDLVQDVFLLALRRLSTLREAGSFGAWLAAIARNQANDYHRHSAPEDQLANDRSENEIGCGHASQDRQGPANQGRANQGPDQHGSAVAILDAVRSLPDAYRETLILRLVEGMTGPEIAARTGLTQGSVRVNLHRGMQQLRAKLGPHPSQERPGIDRPEQETSQS